MLRKLIEESRVRTILLEQFSVSDTGLILDLVCYAIVTENNAGQYYCELPSRVTLADFQTTKKLANPHKY